MVGIEVLGKRLGDEILEVLRPMLDGEEKPLLYVAGHSLGGLMLRYALGYLHSLGVMEKVVPQTYMSICSPHLGVRAPSRVIWRSWINLAAITGITNQQLVYEDSVDEPILATLADREKDYFKALALFESRIAIGVADYDTLVPTPTACICLGTER